MNSMKQTIKQCIPNTIIEKLRNIKNKKRFKEIQKEVAQKRKQADQLIFLLATPNHANIGDQAIAEAERRFLQEQFPAVPMIEISFNEYVMLKELLVTVIQKQDILSYHGGGNMGIQYFECESVFRDIVMKFPNNYVIAFPQTIYYGDSERGKEEFKISKQVYNAHDHLFLFAREKTSYEIMKNAYPNASVALTPDIVLYVKENFKAKREGAMTCFRNDVEKRLDTKKQAEIMQYLEKEFSSVQESDTVVDIPHVEKELGQKLFMNKLNEFAEHEIVLTDRLHGMVFAYLTNTPCVVFSNYNYKVLGVYEWLKNCGFIRYIQEEEDVKAAIVDVLQSQHQEVIDKSLFLPLINAFQEGIKKT